MTVFRGWMIRIWMLGIIKKPAEMCCKGIAVLL